MPNKQVGGFEEYESTFEKTCPLKDGAQELSHHLEHDFK